MTHEKSSLIDLAVKNTVHTVFRNSYEDASIFLQKAHPRIPDPDAGAAYIGNWPVGAHFAVEVERFYRDFDNISIGRSLYFFEHYEDVDKWVEDENNRIMLTNHAYSTTAISWFMSGEEPTSMKRYRLD